MRAQAMGNYEHANECLFYARKCAAPEDVGHIAHRLREDLNSRDLLLEPDDYFELAEAVVSEEEDYDELLASIVHEAEDSEEAYEDDADWDDDDESDAYDYDEEDVGF